MPDSTHSRSTQKVLIWLWYWLPPLLLMVLIFYVSSQPRLPQAPEPRVDALLKKLAHIVEYTLLYILLVRAFHHSQNDLERAMRTSLLATAIYAISDEVHQAFVPGRHANGYDVLIDISGGLLLWGLRRSRGWLRRFRTQDHYFTE